MGSVDHTVLPAPDRGDVPAFTQPIKDELRRSEQPVLWFHLTLGYPSCRELQ